MSKITRHVVTAPTPKSWHPKTSAKKVFWDFGVRAPSAMSPAALKAARSDKPLACRYGFLGGDGSPLILLSCCQRINPNSGKMFIRCQNDEGSIVLEHPGPWSKLPIPTQPLH